MKLTIEKFQQLYSVATSNMDEVDKAISFVQVFTGKSVHDIEKLNVKKFNKLCLKVKNVFEDAMNKANNSKPSNYLWIGRKLFYINYNISELSANKYVETSVYGQELVTNLHKLMASMVYEVKLTWRGLKIMPYNATKHEKISELMLKADFKTCYNMAVFFYLLFRNSLLSMKDYLVAESKNRELVETALTGFTEIMDGFTMPKWCQNLKQSV